MATAATMQSLLARSAALLTASAQEPPSDTVAESPLEKVLGEVCDLTASDQTMCQAFCQHAGVNLVTKLLSEAERTRIKEMSASILGNVCRHADYAQEVLAYEQLPGICCFVFKNEADTRLLSEVVRLFRTVFTVLPPTQLAGLIVDMMETGVLAHFVFIAQNTLSHELLEKVIETFCMLLWTCTKRIQFDDESQTDVVDRFLPAADVTAFVQFASSRLLAPAAKGRGVEISWKVAGLLVKSLGVVASVDSRWRDIVVKHAAHNVLELFGALWPSACRDEDLSEMCFYFLRLFDTLAAVPSFALQFRPVLETLLRADEHSVRQVLSIGAGTSQIALLNMSLSALLLRKSHVSKASQASKAQSAGLITKRSTDDHHTKTVVREALLQGMGDAPERLQALCGALDVEVASTLRTFL